MRTTRSSTNLQRTLGLLLAGAVLGSPSYADDQRARDTCEQYTGAKRTDCEQRRDQDRSAMSTRENDTDEADRSTDDASSSAGTRSDRTRVSRADAENEAGKEDDESKYWDSTREPEPGQVKGADMRSAPVPDREDPNSDLIDPYQVEPGTETGTDESE